MDHSLLSDEDLADRVVAQDVVALDTLYSRHVRVAFALALKLLADRDLAEDVVQESFLKLWRRPQAYDRQRGRLLPWLLGVTHNRAVDLLRHRQLEARHRQDSEAGSAEDLTPGGNPEAQAWHTFQSQTVGRALALLPDAQRQVLELAYFRGLTQSEIAVTLNEPLGTVKTRIRLAMQKLRASVDMQQLRADER